MHAHAFVQIASPIIIYGSFSLFSDRSIFVEVQQQKGADTMQNLNTILEEEEEKTDREIYHFLFFCYTERDYVIGMVWYGMDDTKVEIIICSPSLYSLLSR